MAQRNRVGFLPHDILDPNLCHEFHASHPEHLGPHPRERFHLWCSRSKPLRGSEALSAPCILRTPVLRAPQPANMAIPDFPRQNPPPVTWLLIKHTRSWSHTPTLTFLKRLSFCEVNAQFCLVLLTLPSLMFGVGYPGFRFSACFSIHVFISDEFSLFVQHLTHTCLLIFTLPVVLDLSALP